MNFKIDVDLLAFKRDIDSHSFKLDQAARKLILDGTQTLLAASRNELSELVYNQPIPTRQNGNEAWERSGNLMRQERASYPSRYQGVISNKAPYALPRHELNRPSPVDGKTRRAPWRREAALKTESTLRRMAEDAISDAFD